MWNPFARLMPQPLKSPALRLDLADAAREVDFTPDVAALEMKGMVRLFEYGECMTPYVLYKDILCCSVCHGTAFTVEAKFKMVTNTRDKYPVVLEASRKEQRQVAYPYPNGTAARIKGELHSVTPQTLFELDRRRLNGVRFKRVRLQVDVPHHKILSYDNKHGEPKIVKTGQLHEVTNAWVYIGIKELWTKHLDGGYNFPSSKLIVPDGINPRPYYHFEGK